MQNKIYFPGLNGLRFIAASLVIFHHAEQYKSWAGHESAWGNPFIDSLGHQAVSFFFVLSGFLITYLLLVEHQKKGKISIGAFYWRRLLRIWPLYFLIVTLAVILAPVFSNIGLINIDTTVSAMTITSLVLFLPNLLRLINPTLVGANQLWSVGIEEQFYAFWPLLIRKYIGKIFPFLIGFLLFKLIIHVILLGGCAVLEFKALHQIERLYTLFPVEQMAIGGLGSAIIFYKKSKVIKYLMKQRVLGLSMILLFISSVSGVHFVLKTYFDAVFFTILLLHVTQRPQINRFLENSLLIHLGNISYGIYMWHTLVLSAVLGTLNLSGVTFGLWTNCILYLGSFSLTIGLAHVSYTYFEKPFLRMKEKFAFDRQKITQKAGV